jgi:hypothetical protein
MTVTLKQKQEATRPNLRAQNNDDTPNLRAKDKFRESVRKCVDLNGVLAVAGGCLFSKRAREHVPARSALDNGDKTGPSEGVEEANKPRMTACLVETIVKQHKSHRVLWILTRVSSTELLSVVLSVPASTLFQRFCCNFRCWLWRALASTLSGCWLLVVG